MKNKILITLLMIIAGFANQYNVVATPPNAPEGFNLTATAVCNVALPGVLLEWGVSKNAVKYTIYEKKAGKWEIVVTVKETKQTLYNYDGTLKSGKWCKGGLRTFKVLAVNSAGIGRESSTTPQVYEGNCFAIPAVTISHSIIPVAGKVSPIKLFWTALDNVCYFKIYKRERLANGAYTNETWEGDKPNVGNLEYTDTKVVAGHTYLYRVKAVGGIASRVQYSSYIVYAAKTPANARIGVSEDETQVVVTTANSREMVPPNPLGNFKITKSTVECTSSILMGGRNFVSLDWSPAANAASYTILRDGKEIALLTPFTKSYQEYIKSPSIHGCPTKLPTHKYTVVANPILVGKPIEHSVLLSFTNCNTVRNVPMSTLKVSSVCNGYPVSNGVITWPYLANACGFKVYRFGSPYRVEKYLGYVANTQNTAELNTFVDTDKTRIANTKYSYKLITVGSDPSNTAEGSYSDTSWMMTSKCVLKSGTRESIVEVESENNISVYPNPTTGEFNLNLLNLNNQIVDVNIFDFSGKNVHVTQIIPQAEVNPKINISHLPSGTYLLNASVDGKTYSTKVIKE